MAQRRKSGVEHWAEQIHRPLQGAKIAPVIQRPEEPYVLIAPSRNPKLDIRRALARFKLAGWSVKILKTHGYRENAKAFHHLEKRHVSRMEVGRVDLVPVKGGVEIWPFVVQNSRRKREITSHEIATRLMEKLGVAKR